jgi:hypothetical protein
MKKSTHFMDADVLDLLNRIRKSTDPYNVHLPEPLTLADFDNDQPLIYSNDRHKNTHVSRGTTT